MQIPTTEIEQPAPPIVAPIVQSQKPKGKKAQSHVLLSFEDTCYPSDTESDDERTGGGKMLPLLLMISKPCQVPKKVWCIASSYCNTTWVWPRARQRILDHTAHDCKAVPQEWRISALEHLASKGQARQAKMPRPEEEAGSDVELLEDPPQQKKTKKDMGSGSGSKQSTLGSAFSDKGAQTFKKDAHRKLMLFVTCAGVAPHVIDSPEFKAFCGFLSPQYTLPLSREERRG